MKRLLFVILMVPGLAFGGQMEILSPTNGAEVATLSSLHKEFLALDAAGREAWERDPEVRKRMKAAEPPKTEVRWRYIPSPGEKRPSRFALTVRRKSDGFAFDRRLVSGRTNRVALCGLEIGTDYRLRIAVFVPKKGEVDAAEIDFRTEAEAPRVLTVEGVNNVRDLGGWTVADGRRIRQGLVFRAQAFNDNASYRVKGTKEVKPKSEWTVGAVRGTPSSRRDCLLALGIRTELDFRRREDETWRMKGSPLGRSVDYVQIPSACYSEMKTAEAKASFAKAFRHLTKAENYPIVFHCIAGADRTGTFAYILGGLLGMSERDLDSDYHFTAFSGVLVPWPFIKDTDRLTMLKKVFARYAGKSLQERIRAYALDAGIKPEEIEAVRSILLDDGERQTRAGSAYRRFLRATTRERRNMMVDPLVRREMSEAGTPPAGVATNGTVRWQGLTGNMRDLGGWRGLENCRIRYGRLFRSACFGRQTPAAEAAVKALGIRTDLDLRAPGGNRLGCGTDYENRSAPAYREVFTDEGRKWFRSVFDLLLDEARYPIAFHCAKGADRTGSLAALVELLLGVDEDDVAKDWQLTAFFNPNPLFEDTRYDSFMDELGELPGATWREKAEAFARSCGITEAEIVRFREMLLEAPLVEVGLVSDTHITGEKSRSRGKGRDNLGCEDAFCWFAREGVDVVANVGDVTEGGNLEEVSIYRQIFERAFPKGLCRDGRRSVAHVSVWGNHDYFDASYMRKLDMSAERPTSIPANRERCERELNGEASAGESFVRQIHGVVFAGVSWNHEELGVETLREAARQAQGRPFFYLQHSPADSREFKAERAKHPNCIRLSGHSHIPIDDPRAMVLENNGMTVRGGSTSVLGHPENGCGVGRFGRGERHAAILRLWRDRVTIERRELVNDEPLGDEVTIQPKNREKKCE